MEIKNDSLDDIKKYLEDEFCMDPEETIEMVDLFFESIEDSIKECETAISSSSAEQLAGIGHAIKGSSANINATGFAEIGLTLETAGKNSDIPTCTEALTALKTAFASLKEQ